MRNFRQITTATAASALLLMGGYAVQAADLGGNCCADLEERVAELEATTARKGNRVQSLTVYGQVNTAIMWHNQELSDAPQFPERSKLSVLDNSNSQSRFGFKGSARINSDVSAGFRIEIGVGGLNDEDLDGTSTTALATRYAYAEIVSKSLGTIQLGQISQASDGATGVNLGAPTAYTLHGFGPSTSALGYNAIGGFPLGDIFSVQDGGRAQAIRYISPDIGGFSLSASTTGDEHDVALRYAGEFGAIRVAAAAAWREDKDLFGAPVNVGVDAEHMIGSASIMHVPSGIYVAGSYGHSEGKGLLDGAELDKWSATLGVRIKNTLGTVNLYGHYGEAELSIGTDDANLDAWGLGLEQEIDSAATVLYVHYQSIDTGPLAAVTGDINTFLAGVKVSF